MTFDPVVNFTIDVAVVDGVLCPPFSSHSRRDGPLQRAGMTTRGWLAWVKAVVRARSEDASPADPSDLWPGNEEVSHILQQRWKEYESTSSRWRVSAIEQVYAQREERKNVIDVTEALKGLPPLRILGVHYAVPAAIYIHPASALLALPTEVLDVELMDRLIAQVVVQMLWSHSDGLTI